MEPSVALSVFVNIQRGAHCSDDLFFFISFFLSFKNLRITRAVSGRLVENCILRYPSLATRARDMA